MISICLLTKCENVYLKEWVNHHLSIGIDHFYIYDNNNDFSAKDEILSHFEAKHFTFVHWLTYCNHMQIEAYNDCLDRFGGDNEWIAFIDTDEFIKCNDIHEAMSPYEHFDYVRIPWVMYNANGRLHYSDEPVTERFTCISDVVLDDCAYKSIVNTNKIRRMSVHEPSGSYWYTVSETIKLNHYYTRSLDEWVDKIRRGTCSPLAKKRYDEFFMYNPDMIEYKSNFDLCAQAYHDCAKSCDIKIMAHPSRRHHVLKMLDALGADEDIVVYDDRTVGGDAMYTARMAWLSPFSENTTHRLVLQDDVLLCDNFLDIVSNIVNTASNKVISLFDTIPSDLVKKKPCCYVRCNNLCGVAIIMPRIYIQDCWEWIDAHHGDCLCDDLMISEYCRKHGIPTYTTIPSIVQHIGDTELSSLLPARYACTRISTTYRQHPTDDFTVFVHRNQDIDGFVKRVRSLRAQRILHRKDDQL